MINTQIKTWCDLSKLRTRLFSSLCNQSTVNKEVHIYYKGYKLNKDNNIAGNSDPLKKWLWQCEIPQTRHCEDESLRKARDEICIPERACCSNLCIVKAKDEWVRFTSPFVCSFFPPTNGSSCFPLSDLPLGDESFYSLVPHLNEVGGMWGGYFNHLYKYLHSHGLTLGIVYYFISFTRWAPPLIQTRLFTSSALPFNKTSTSLETLA